MTKATQPWYRDVATWFALLLISPVFGWVAYSLFGTTLGKLGASEWAAWVQAIFSVVAIGASAWIVQRQHHLEKERDAERAKDAKAERLNAALLVSCLQLNRLRNFNDQRLKPHRESAIAFAAVQPTTSMGRVLELDLVPLADLALLGDPRATNEWSMSDAKYGAAILAIDTRSAAHREFQHAVEDSDLPASGFTTNELKKAIGMRLFLTITEATDQVFETVDDALAALVNVGKTIPDVLKSHYPEHRFIRFE